MFKRNTIYICNMYRKKRIALAIWSLSTGNSYRSVSNVFGVGISTACTIVNRFCTEIAALAGDFIQFPRNGRETAEEIQKFNIFTECAISQVVGAIEGTHIEILPPEGDNKVY